MKLELMLIMAKPMLTQKQEGFTLDLYKGLTETDAYKNHYNTENMSIEAIYVAACRLKQNAKVALRLAELRAPRENKAIASVEERLEILTEIERGRFGHFADEEGNLDIPNKEALNSAALHEVKTTKFTGGKDGRASEMTTTIKLRDPVAAIAEHNKMDGSYAPVRTDHTFNGEGLSEVLLKLRGYQAKELEEGE